MGNWSSFNSFNLLSLSLPGRREQPQELSVGVRFRTRGKRKWKTEQVKQNKDTSEERSADGRRREELMIPGGGAWRSNTSSCSQVLGLYLFIYLECDVKAAARAAFKSPWKTQTPRPNEPSGKIQTADTWLNTDFECSKTKRISTWISFSDVNLDHFSINNSIFEQLLKWNHEEVGG